MAANYSVVDEPQLNYLGSRVFVRSYELAVHADVEYLPSPSLKRLLDYYEMIENH
jgi:hypothetical protein